MRSFLALITSLILPIAVANMIPHTPSKAPMPNHSEELKALAIERTALQASKNSFEESQDLWHNIAVGLAVFAALLGIAAGASQFRESKFGYKVRAKSEEIFSKEQRIGELEKEDSALAIATIGKEASDANDRAGKAVNRAAEIGLEQAQLEATYAPRRLSIEQQDLIGKACLGLTGKKILVTSYALDSEGMVLGQQIANALHSGGLQIVPRLSGLTQFGGFEYGIVIKGLMENSEPVVSCLEKALHDIGKLEVCISGTEKCGLGSPDPGPNLEASILIGVKPVVLIPAK